MTIIEVLAHPLICLQKFLHILNHKINKRMIMRQTIYKALETAGVWFTWHEFNAAHAFLRDEGERYDPAVGKLCISLASDLFQRNL